MQIENSALIEPKHLVHPNPWVGHIPFASWLVARLKPNIVVELGTHTGNSYMALCQSVAENRLSTKLYAVDTWQGDEHAGFYGEDVFENLNAYNDQAYKSFSTLKRMLFDDALSDFSDNSIDLLHIDGLHTYDAVKHDFETWLPKLTDRAVVLFHDTAVFHADFGVHKLWDELSAQYPGFNFLHSNGLGVLLVGTQRDRELLKLTGEPETNADWQLFRRTFATLGANIERRYEIDRLNAELGAKKNEIQDLISRSALAEANWRDKLNDKEAQLDQSMQQVDRKQNELNRARNELDQARNELDQVRNVLDQVYGSTSWAVTRPLRYLSSLVIRR